MTATTALVRTTEARGVEVRDLTELRTMGELFARSGYFRDARDMAQACVKMQAGLELGIGPAQSMSGVHIVEGKPTLSSTLIASLIKRSGRYTYRVLKHDDNECQIVFVENGQQIGVSAFTWADAEKAGLTRNPVWSKFRRNMLFARAISNGARWHCPDVFGGAVYTPEELGGDMPPEAEPVKAAAAVVASPVAEKISRATVAELQQAVRAELDRLLVGNGMAGDELKAARTAAVKRVHGGKAPRTTEEWTAVLEALEAEPTPATLDGAESATDSAA